MKRVLVTGAQGFLGRHTVRELELRGWEVVPAARTAVSGQEVLIDLEDPLFVERLGALDPCDAVVHLAAKADWSPAMSHALYRVNVHATSSLITLAQAWGATFVFSSAAMVCGARTASIHAESPVVPDTPYGQTKWLAEQLLGAAGIPAAILRLGGIFGAGGPSHLGLNRAITAALAGEVPAIAGKGAARRNYIYVKDAAAAIAHALERELTGTHLVAGSETLTIAEYLYALCAAVLPGKTPVAASGAEAGDQIITRSELFPPTRSAAEAMRDLRDSRA